MQELSLLASVVSGIIGGILAILFDRAIRRMIAPTIIKRKIQIGEISKSTYIPPLPESWYIPVHVKASIWWKLLVSKIDDVEPSITFIQYGGLQTRVETVWLNPAGSADNPSISLGIGTKRKIGLVQIYNMALIPYGQLPAAMVSNIHLVGDYDILLELSSGDKKLGCWKFQKTIIGGSIQEVIPLRIN